jgi:hypothetical protein
MKEIGILERKGGKVEFGLMETNLMATGLITKNQEKETTIGQMGINIADNSMRINERVMEFTTGIQEKVSRAIGIEIM